MIDCFVKLLVFNHKKRTKINRKQYFESYQRVLERRCRVVLSSLIGVWRTWNDWVIRGSISDKIHWILIYWIRQLSQVETGWGDYTAHCWLLEEILILPFYFRTKEFLTKRIKIVSNPINPAEYRNRKQINATFSLSSLLW